MCLHVAVEVSRLGESQVADLAAIRLVSGVDALVLGKGGGVRKALPTEVASVWPFSRVGAEVSRDG